MNTKNIKLFILCLFTLASSISCEGDLYNQLKSVLNDYKPRLMTPIEGEIICTPTFTWESAHGSDTNRLEIAMDPEFQQIIYYVVLIDESHTLSEADAQMLPEGINYWRIIGEYSDYTDSRSFIYYPDCCFYVTTPDAQYDSEPDSDYQIEIKSGLGLRSNPYHSIQKAIDAATGSIVQQIKVSHGHQGAKAVYHEKLVMNSALVVTGGYDPDNWELTSDAGLVTLLSNSTPIVELSSAGTGSKFRNFSLSQLDPENEYQRSYIIGLSLLQCEAVIDNIKILTNGGYSNVGIRSIDDNSYISNCEVDVRNADLTNLGIVFLGDSTTQVSQSSFLLMCEGITIGMLVGNNSSPAVDRSMFTFSTEYQGTSTIGIQARNSSICNISNSIFHYDDTTNNISVIELENRAVGHVINNTIVIEGQSNSTFLQLASLNSSNHLIANNIFYCSPSSSNQGIVETTESIGTIELLNNCFFGTVSTTLYQNFDGTTLDITDNSLIIQNIKHSSNINEEPVFVDAQAKNFALSASTSANIRFGGVYTNNEKFGFIVNDYNGLQRTVPYSIGAYEID